MGALSATMLLDAYRPAYNMWKQGNNMLITCKQGNTLFNRVMNNAIPSK